MQQFQELWVRIRLRSNSLLRAFDESAAGQDARAFFDELIEGNELELALIRVCDFLFESAAPLVIKRWLGQIKELQQMMNIEEDDSITKLEWKLKEFEHATRSSS